MAKLLHHCIFVQVTAEAARPEEAQLHACQAALGTSVADLERTTQQLSSAQKLLAEAQHAARIAKIQQQHDARLACKQLQECEARCLTAERQLGQLEYTCNASLAAMEQMCSQQLQQAGVTWMPCSVNLACSAPCMDTACLTQMLWHPFAGGAVGRTLRPGLGGGGAAHRDAVSGSPTTA